MDRSLKVCVVGAGINGVACAIQIISNHPDIDITLVADSFTPNTTSDAAAGYWRPPPSYSREIEKRYLKWGQLTKDFILNAVYNDQDAHLKGLLLCHGYHLAKKQITLPYWRNIALNLEMLSDEDLKKFPKCFRSGYRYTAPVTEGRFFIPYFMKLFLEKGGKVIKRKLTSLQELYNDFDIIINCSGVGARDLLNDDGVHPIRGYVLRVYAPWVKEFIYTLEPDKNSKTIYIYPLKHCVVIGGYKQINDSNTNVIEQERTDILKDASEIIPSLAKANIISENVGFRPGRKHVRLELELLGENKAVIHNYGHGGSGLSLYWGCSLEVLDIFNNFVESRKTYRKSKL